MNRLNRYARDGSILSLLPNPLTRVDLTPLTPRSDQQKSAATTGRLNGTTGPQTTSPPGRT